MTRPAKAHVPSADQLDIPQRVAIAAAAVRTRKAAELKVIRISEVAEFTDYFVICHGTNQRQVQAIADAARKSLRDAGVRPLHVEGYDRADWVLLDYGDLVLHIFDEEHRDFYDLERLWGDAPDVTGDFEE